MKRFFKKQNVNVIKVLISLLIVIILLAVTGFFSGNNKKLVDYIEIKTFLAIVLFFIVDALSFLVISAFSKRLEDGRKLTKNYKHLIKDVYPLETFFTFVNADTSKVVFPNTLIYEKQKDVTFSLLDDKDRQYVLPEFCKKNYDELFAAHRYSKKNNKLVYRLDDVVVSEKRVELKTSRTTSYDGLVTNRCMDYAVNELSVRELYDSGPFMQPLARSKMSNHAGYTAFVETSDDYVLFYYKRRNSETYKGSLGPTITNMISALDVNNTLTLESIEQFIARNINRRVQGEVVSKFSLAHNTLAISRSAIEGGGAHFIVSVKSTLSLADITNKESSGDIIKFTSKNRRGLAIKKETLLASRLLIDKLCTTHKQYKSSPQTMFALALLINHAKKR